MSGNKPKGKDKGKSIRRAEDYQIAAPTRLPLQNQFQTLADYPPLPYKTVVSRPTSKPTANNSYTILHTEHLCLTTHKTVPPMRSLNHWFKRSLAICILPLITHKKPNNFMS